jgi:hypothetical protein
MGRRLPPRNAYVLDTMLEAHVFALAQAGDVDTALAAAGSARLYPPGAEVWRAIGAAAGRQGAVDAVRARGPAWRDAGPRAMFLLGLAEGLIARAGTEDAGTPARE